MAVLVAYIDDSKSDSYLTMAGYSFVVGETHSFEKKWSDTLKYFGVPYLHMREFKKPNSVYEHLKSDPGKMASFFMMLVNAIQQGADSCVASSIRLGDLEEFNKDHDLNLHPCAVAIYGCLLNFSLNTPQDWRDKLEINFDHFERSMRHACMAEDYYLSDTSTKNIKNISFSINMLKKNENYKTIYQLQAADFLAWEVRKNLEDNKDFRPSHTARRNVALLQKEYEKYAAQHQNKHGRQPRERISYLELISGMGKPKTNIWTRDDLEEALTRHHDGWGGQER